jgi:hypothetical protein
MKPDYLVIGVMKCATSTVCAYLEDHPDVFMVPGMDPSFFSDDSRYAQGWGWYESLFQDRKSEMICGEGSNPYMAGAMWPNTAKRIAEHLPDAKLVLMVRHPLERIVSTWIQDRSSRGDTIPPTLDRAVLELPERYVDQSLYWKNLNSYRDYFSDDQIFIGFMEEMNQSPAEFFDQLTAFLGVPSHAMRRGHMNPSATKRIPTETYTKVNGMWLTQALKPLVPKSMKTFVKGRILSRSASERPVLSDAVKRKIIPELRADSALFLSHAKRPADFWTF